MQRVRVEYADHYEAFRKILPRCGCVVRHLREVSDDRLWTLISLDEPFEWQRKVGEPFKFRLLKIDHFLVAPRRSGTEIGESEPAPVFISLVEECRVPSGESFAIRDYPKIAWGVCHTL